MGIDGITEKIELHALELALTDSLKAARCQAEFYALVRVTQIQENTARCGTSLSKPDANFVLLDGAR